MRSRSAFVLALSIVIFSGLTPRPAASAMADAPDFSGRWKLVLMLFGEDELLIVDLKPIEGKLAGTITGARPGLGPIKAAEGTAEGDRVTLTFPAPNEPWVFRGVVGKDGKAFGSIRIRTYYPARLEKTEAREVARSQVPPSRQKLLQAQALPDAKARVAQILDLIRDNPGHSSNAPAYSLLLGSAGSAGLSPDVVRKHIATWIDQDRLYGPEWLADIQVSALKAIQGKKAYAELATELATAVEKVLPADASLEQRASVANMLARSARLAGKDEIAEEAESRAKLIDAKLDAEYHDKVPPFQPETYAGRAEGKGDRVVLMEIFTGAECPPCVAADLAFDALLESFKPTELIGLQYHLHIPGPDPLTSEDSIARQGYYGPEVRGTPSTFFNGKAASGGGGSMAGAEDKYHAYREVIEPALASVKRADISLTATRAGDEVKIVARAKARPGDGDTAKSAEPRLRLILVEHSVRYPGGNKLRFHHNVVRAIPGGVEGKALEDGAGEVEVTADLTEIRKAQENYLKQYPSRPRGRAFPNPLPPIELDDLAVVAMVQDDSDHCIWHAVQVPVEEVKP